jgi:hypothetical protein
MSSMPTDLVDDPAPLLVASLGLQRTIVRQALATAALVAACALWWALPLDRPSMVATYAAVGAIALVVASVALFFAHERARVHTDQLILTGCRPVHQSAPVVHALARRIARIETSRSRRGLADSLRWRLRLSEATPVPATNHPRAAFLPMTRSERGVYAAERELVAAVADRLERAPAEPRALVLLWDVLRRPSQDSNAAAEELRRALVTAARLIDLGSRGPVDLLPAGAEAGRQ